jgi:hypothetical protein
MIKNDKKFCYSRFGDGDFLCMLGHGGKNRDKHNYFPDLEKRLVDIIYSKPEYYVGTRTMRSTEKVKGQKFDAIKSQIKWEDSEIFVTASINGDLQRFFDAMKTKKVLYVANGYLLKLDKFEFKKIPVGQINCWLEYEKTKKELSGQIRSVDIVLYSACMMSKVLIDDFKHIDVTQIDMGSVFDPYVGICSRGYHSALMKSWEK